MKSWNNKHRTSGKHKPRGKHREAGYQYERSGSQHLIMRDGELCGRYSCLALARVAMGRFLVRGVMT